MNDIKKQPIHFRNSDVLSGAPLYVKQEYYNQNMDGALCGYVRRNTTTDKNKVTCFYCKRKLEEIK